MKSKLLNKTSSVWHHADVKGLAGTEFERNSQLVDVFGNGVQVVRHPDRAEPDAVWTVKWQNKTIDPFTAQERGVVLVHVRDGNPK